MLHLRQGDVALAREREEEAIALFRAEGDRLGEAHRPPQPRRNRRATVATMRSARKLFEQCLAISRAHWAPRDSRASASGTWASFRWPRATSTAHDARFVRSLEVCRDAEDKRNEAIALWCLGKVDAAGGDRESARAKFTEALRAFESFQMSSEALDCLEEFAALMQESGRSVDAVRVHAATAAIRDRLTIPRLQRAESRRLASLGAAREVLGEAAFEAAWADGATWALDDAIDAALSFADELVLAA